MLGVDVDAMACVGHAQSFIGVDGAAIAPYLSYKFGIRLVGCALGGALFIVLIKLPSDGAAPASW